MPYWYGDVAFPPEDSTLNVTARARAESAEAERSVLNSILAGQSRGSGTNSLSWWQDLTRTYEALVLFCQPEAKTIYHPGSKERGVQWFDRIISAASCLICH